MARTQFAEPDLEFIRDIKKAGGETLKKCYQCATCSVVCNLSPEERPFPRKEMILAGWGQTRSLVSDPDIWLCYQCNDCSTYCPRDARPGDVLASIRSYIYRHFSFPSFMGKALASPKALPLLLLVPILILSACIYLFAPRTETGRFLFVESGTVDFNIFLPHSAVDALFVFGNILIFALAAVGFYRFWIAIQEEGAVRAITFTQALWLTVNEIISHARFRDCEANRPRRVGHMILFFGFLGAMFTTGAVLVFVFLPHYFSLLGLEGLEAFFTVPIDLPHPVKILGALSGLALVVGGGLLIYRRLTNRDKVGANGYADYLFLYILFFTGASGMLSWLMRIAEVPALAYASYFIHLVFVFFLLWYMPYSKFAHMIYRTLALVQARQSGRVVSTR